MKIKSKGKKKRLFIGAAIVLTILLSLSIFFWIKSQEDAKQKIAENEYVKESKSKPKKKDKEPQPAESPQQIQEEGEKITRTSDRSSNTGSPEAPTITRAEQVGDTIRISAMLNKPSSGRCVLKLSQTGSATIQKDVSVVVGPSYYICNGFRIPRSEFPVGGTWNILVVHQLGGQSSSSDGSTINVN